jgi:hypothetical protein
MLYHTPIPLVNRIVSAKQREVGTNLMNELVYALYGLTPEEIKIVEEST